MNFFHRQDSITFILMAYLYEYVLKQWNIWKIHSNPPITSNTSRLTRMGTAGVIGGAKICPQMAPNFFWNGIFSGREQTYRFCRLFHYQESEPETFKSITTQSRRKFCSKWKIVIFCLRMDLKRGRFCKLDPRKFVSCWKYRFIDSKK